MGKHSGGAVRARTEAADTSAGAARPVRTRPLPVRSTVRLRRPVDIWRKTALSAAAALALPDLTLLALGRLDLILYTSAGAMCALYAHGLPYAARARTLAGVVLGMTVSLGAALTAGSLIGSPALLVPLAALLAAVHKMACDATRIGPPGNLILTFIASSAFFVPQRTADVPFHVALALGGGAVAWLICMAPGPVRPHGPERTAVARALEAAAALWRARARAPRPPAAGDDEAGVPAARRAVAATVSAAWHTLRLVPEPGRAPDSAGPAPRSDGGGSRARPGPVRTGLERLLVHAESSLAAPEPGPFAVPGTDRTPGPAGEADRCAELARALRGGGPLPVVGLTAAEDRELAGVAAERNTPAPGAGADRAPDRRTALRRRPRRPAPDGQRGPRAVLARLRPGSPLLPAGARVAAGCALAGWVSLAAGVGHPYWAVVTAASVYQANTTLSWQRAVQRVLGNVLGLGLFFALLPLVRTGHLAMVLLVLALQIGAEALITRNYWLGSVCVTPMALLLTEFGGALPARTLISDRLIDTLVGAAAGLACCVVVTNRRAADRIEDALARVAAAEHAARRALDEEPDGTDTARARLASALTELREAFEVASGEWWQRALPTERVTEAERSGHHALALLVRHSTAAPAPVCPPTTAAGRIGRTDEGGQAWPRTSSPG